MRRVIFWTALLTAGFLLAGCKSQASAADSVMAYLQARVQSDVDKMIGLSCPDWEAQARIEASTFKALNASSTACRAKTAAPTETPRSCRAKARSSRPTTAKPANGASRTGQFKTVLDDGEWRMCGYQ